MNVLIEELETLREISIRIVHRLNGQKVLFKMRNINLITALYNQPNRHDR